MDKKTQENSSEANLKTDTAIIQQFIVTCIMIIIGFIWIRVFPAEKKVVLTDVFYEGINLILFYIGFFIINKLDIKIFKLGWLCVLLSSLLDVMDEFTNDPDLFGSYIPGIINMTGILLAVIGLFLTYKRTQKELAESIQMRKALKTNKEKYRKIIENIENITSNMLYYINNLSKPEIFAKEGPEKTITHSLEKIINTGDKVASMASTFSRLLDNIQHMNLSLLEKEKIKNEMSMAKKIQLTSLPEIENRGEYQMSARILPADDVGGDFYDYITTDSGRSLFIIGDVSGHGLNAGLIMFMVQSSVRTLLLSNPDISLEKLVCELNTFLYLNIVEKMKIQEFATFIVVEGFEDGQFEAAGFHPFPLIYREKEGICEEINVEGMYLGFIKKIDHIVNKTRFKLEEGDILVLYTDGIIEARDADNGLYDYNRFKEIICENSSLNMENLADTIIKDVQDFMSIQKDDMTLFIIKRERPGALPGRS